jgi:hypothetical protein
MTAVPITELAQSVALCLATLTYGEISVETALTILDEAKRIVQNQTPFTIDFRPIPLDSKGQEGGASC